MFVYCLFCTSFRCRRIAWIAEQTLSCRAISPKQRAYVWRRGERIVRERDLLPGYVFLYFEVEPADIKALTAMNGVIRCLESSSGEYALSGEDEQFARMLLESDGVFGMTNVYREGDRIRICEGAFAGLETKILKVNRRNSRMLVEIPFAMRPVQTWVGYEIVEADGG